MSTFNYDREYMNNCDSTIREAKKYIREYERKYGINSSSSSSDCFFSSDCFSSNGVPSVSYGGSCYASIGNVLNSN